MAEIVGTVASAVTLASVVLEVITFLRVLPAKILNAPETIRQQALSVEQLVSIAHLIDQNSRFQTPLLKSILGNCRHDAEALRAILAKLVTQSSLKKYWKSLPGVTTKESQIHGLLKKLEEGKTSLILCIASIDSEALGHVKVQVGTIHQKVGSLTQELPAIRDTHHGITTILDQLPRILSDLNQIQTGMQLISTKVMGDLDKGNGLWHDPDFIGSQLPALPQALTRLNLQQGSTVTSESTFDPAEVAEYNERRIACLSSLAPTDQTLLLSQLVNRSESTCQWIFSHQPFQLWLEAEDSQLLHITAGPGRGKTTIAAHIVRRLMDIQHEVPKSGDESKYTISDDRKLVILRFFFQRANTEAEGSAIAALGSILGQVVDQLPALFPYLLWKYEYIATKGIGNWSWDLLWGVFKEIIQNFPPQSTLLMIFDAVDECHVDSRMKFLEEMASLVRHQHLPNMSSDELRLKILVTSRAAEDVVNALSGFSCIEINNSQSASDMELFIQSRVAQLSCGRHLDPMTSETIQSFLKTNAQGMFLWVALILAELERRDQRLTTTTITSRLSSVPLTLVNVYRAILNNAPSSRLDDVWRILRWLALGKRVLNLSELEAALCEEVHITRWHDLLGDIMYLCGSLVRVDENTDVYFVHETARGFIIDHAVEFRAKDTGGITMTPPHAEADLATLSLSYVLRTDSMGILDRLTSLLHFKSTRQYISVIDQLLGSMPFLSYAVENWAVHLQAANTPEQTLRHLVLQFLDSSVRRDAIMRLTHFFSHSGSPSAPINVPKLHIASYFNLPWLVALYLEEGADPNEVGCMDDTALIWAAEMGSLEPVKTLLHAGTDPNKAERDNWTALHWAARNGHVQVAEVLLQNGAKAEARDWNDNSPLDWAIGRGNIDVATVIQKYCGVSESKERSLPPEDLDHRDPNSGPLSKARQS